MKAVWEGHQRYLRFTWLGTTYEFQCLPFGLYSVSRVFTKLLKPVLAWLSQQGTCVIMYLDDILLMAQSRNNLERQLEHIALLPEGLGFVVNRKKSHLHPIQSLQFLGFLVNSQEMSIKLIEEKTAQMSKLAEWEVDSTTGTWLGSCHFCREGICQGHKECSHPTKDGQKYCHILCKPDGRDSLHSTEQLGNSPVAMVPRENTSLG